MPDTTETPLATATIPAFRAIVVDWKGDTRFSAHSTAEDGAYRRLQRHFATAGHELPPLSAFQRHPDFEASDDAGERLLLDFPYDGWNVAITKFPLYDDRED